MAWYVFNTMHLFIMLIDHVYIYFSILYEGTKGMANAMKSIAMGRVKDKGKTWFPELSDKSK